MSVTAAPPSPSPRTFASPGEALDDVAGVVRRAGPIAGVYLRGDIDPELRARVMAALSHVNACRGRSCVHERWATRTGVAADELESIGLGELADVDTVARSMALANLSANTSKALLARLSG